MSTRGRDARTAAIAPFPAMLTGLTGILANAGTALMAAPFIHLLLSNLIIAAVETIVLTWLFRRIGEHSAGR